MNEVSESAKKEARKELRYSVGWLILLGATFFILLAIMPFLEGGPRRLSEWIPTCLFLFVVSFSIATALVGGCWLGRWLCRWRNLKRLFLAGVGFALLVGLFYAEEDWRGWHTWNRFKHQWEAKGEHFDLASAVPPPVPAEQNFALTPIVFSSYGQVLTREGKVIPADKRDGNFVARMRMALTLDYPGPTNGAGDWTRGTFIPLEAWQTYYHDLAAKTNAFPVPAQPQSAAADVLLALSRYEAPLEELRAASRLPSSRFPLNYDCEPPWGILLPHLAALKSCTQVLRLRSVAELKNGQPDRALEDVQLGLQLADKVRTEPFLISHLVRIAMVQLMLQPVWEGLANHQWSDAQLSALEAQLATLDFPAAWGQSMHSELGAMSDSMQLVRRHPERLSELEALMDWNGHKLFPKLPGGFAARLIPAGWFYQNQVHCARGIEEYCLPLADAGRGTFSPELAHRTEAALAAETPSVFNLFERGILPLLRNTAPKFACGQAVVNLARTALALERCRLACGHLPETLDALAPQYLAKVPHDVIGGQALKYRQETGGQFILYSVGWNATDDGGGTSLKQDGPADIVRKDGTVDIEKGDWVWRYPSPTPR